MLMLSATVVFGCAAKTAKGEESSQAISESKAQEASTKEDENQVNTASADGASTAEETVTSEENNDFEEWEEKMAQIPALRDSVSEVMDCRIGCAVTGSEIDDPKVFSIITKHFNAVTLGNELKPDALFGYSNSTCPGTQMAELNGEMLLVPVMDFSRAEYILDKFYDWNQQNPDRQIKIRGHVLVWHSQTPEWFFHEDYDKSNPYVTKEEMNKRLEWYISSVFNHFLAEDSKYKDMFYGWDVVNEAISDSNGKLRTDSENSEPLNKDTHGSNSSWYHIYKDNEFIIKAFTYANKYAPDSLELYYNDYNECNAIKREGIAELLTAIKEKEGPKGEGTRISAMGMQGHYGPETPAFSDVEYSAKVYGRIVGNVQITELDITASDGYDGSDEAKVAEDEKLKKRYNVLYFALKAVDKGEDANVTAINFWGTVDHYSWLQSRSNVGGGNTSGLPQYPLLFDENYLPKSCFWVFAENK